ncbi:MAG: HU family DNA-binding protein [Rickettsiaceae bacterium]|jgi:DNA-binding protein HU-beta|nr:HU family DNA-binding protein [Rickettsiaceae bacterium]
MNKLEFVKHMAEQHNCTQIESEKALDMFVSSAFSALSEGKEISLMGFGNFSISKAAARTGRNPRTGEAIEIPAYNQVQFKVGKTLKNSCNKG